MPRVPFDPATDYYQLLGLKSSASSSEIQAAYRRLAKTYHPDLHAGSAVAAARMARVNVAKSVLLDRETRAVYDRIRALRHPTRTAVVNGHSPYVTRPSYRYAPPEVIRPTRRGRVDRTTGVLLALVLPLLAALLLYVVEAVQMAGQPVRTAGVDLGLSNSGRPVTRNTADVVWLMVHAYPPSPSLAQQANNLIISRNDQTPEGELLRAVGRHLLQAGRSGDTVAWQAAVAEVCVLASRC